MLIRDILEGQNIEIQAFLSNTSHLVTASEQALLRFFLWKFFCYCLFHISSQWANKWIYRSQGKDSQWKEMRRKNTMTKVRSD